MTQRRTWSRCRVPAALASAVVAVFALAGGCASPTAIRVTVYSEIPCDAHAEVSIALATDAPSLAQAAPAAVATRCDPAESGTVRRGEVVIAPQRSKDKLVAFSITTRDDDQPVEGCAKGFNRCISARRELFFQNHETVDVQINLRRSCLGIECPSDQTCVKGACVASRIAGCNPCVEPLLNPTVQQTRVCGDTSGLPADAPWPLVFGCPTNAGRSPLVDGPATGATLLAPTGDWPAGVKGAVISAGNHVFLQEHVSGKVERRDLPSGERKWQGESGGSGVNPTGLVAKDGRVYFTTNYGKLLAYDPETGVQLWMDWVAGSFSPPIMGPANRIYFGSQDWGIWAVDVSNPTTPTTKWNFTALPSGGNVLTPPALGDGILYAVETRENRLHAFDAETGAERFNVLIGGSASGAPVLGIGLVFVATSDHGVFAFDAKSGATKWQHDSGQPLLQPALLANGDLVEATLGIENGGVTVLDYTNGAVVRTLPVKGKFQVPPIVGALDSIYLTTDTATIAVSPRNEQRWQSTLFGIPSLAEGALVVLPPGNATLALIGP